MALNPHNLLQQALACYSAGDFNAVRQICLQVLQALPHNADALHLLGMTALSQQQDEEAVSLLSQACRHNRKNALFLFHLGNAQMAVHAYEPAARSYRAALKLQPENAAAHFNLGCACQQLQCLDEAVRHFTSATRLQPDYRCHYNLGNLHLERLQAAAAEAEYRQAIRLCAEFAPAWTQLANALRLQQRSLEAISTYQQALRLDADSWLTHLNLGNTLYECRRLDEATFHFQRVLQLQPEQAEAHLGLAQLQLLRGDYPNGWQSYEWRRRIRQAPALVQALPEWDGSPHSGRRVLIYAEQGLGDGLQFVRLLHEVRARGSEPGLYAAAPLVRLFELSGFAPVFPLSTLGNATGYDAQIPLLSLPRLCGTTLASLPGPMPYLRADPRQVQCWAQRLAAVPGLKVGLVWGGNPGKGQALELLVDQRRRSIPLAQWLPLTGIAGVSYFSLQKGTPAQQIAKLGFPLIDWTRELEDFAATAALVSCLDLVISVDTAVAHLAGGLGKPVWLLSRFDGCWRWLLERTDSPWYPSLRLFRQRQAGDWEELMLRVRQELLELLAITAV